jgi:hypothetical protein
MANYPPPKEIVPIFNPNSFEHLDESITIAKADARYLQLSGGVETGLVNFNAGLRTSDGSASTPAYSFNSETSTGVYLGSGHHINFSSLGAQRFHVADDHIRCFEPLRLNELDTPCLTFQGDQDSGIRWVANDDWRMMVNSKDMLRIQNSFVSVLEHPFLIAHQTLGTEPTQYYTGFQAVSGLRNETLVVQECGAGLRALKFLPNHNTPAVSDVLYRFQNNGGSQEIRINNEMQLSLNNGTVSRPSLSFQGSQNTGMFFGSSSLIFSHTAIERARISNNGLRIGVNGTNFTHLLTGSFQLTPNLTNGSASSFSAGNVLSGFTSTPIILITAHPTVGSGFLDRCIYTLTSPSTTTFSVQIANISGSTTTGNVQINWVAIGS